MSYVLEILLAVMTFGYLCYLIRLERDLANEILPRKSPSSPIKKSLSRQSIQPAWSC